MKDAPERVFRHTLINPVLDKEFRLRMRSFRSPLAILLYLIAVGLLAFGFIYLNVLGSGGAPRINSSQSRDMFYFLSVAQLVLVAFMTPGLTAGVISGEREKQTLGMLLTTQMSSTTIVVSKLVSALSFMLLVVVATLPIYSIVFLYGGISPGQLALVFLFYVFTMVALGAFGVLFSTLMKRTMVAVVVTYGTMLFLFGGTALAYLFLQGIDQALHNNGSPGTAHFYWIGLVIGMNPVAALLSIFEPGMSEQIYRSPGNGIYEPPFAIWQQFVVGYALLAAGAIWLSVRYIRPRLKRRG
ncbi:ABC transporter permease [Paenibacillus cymbidii]|uniref:ABC transporter permease n=1 Tax=Paenibacillus cymbidii TaxID=1639034 RepID=UPI001F22972E|nr:ABC transporter permease [Paenibacillus cymbidii]